MESESVGEDSKGEDQKKNQGGGPEAATSEFFLDLLGTAGFLGPEIDGGGVGVGEKAAGGVDFFLPESLVVVGQALTLNVDAVLESEVSILGKDVQGGGEAGHIGGIPAGSGGAAFKGEMRGRSLKAITVGFEEEGKPGKGFVRVGNVDGEAGRVFTHGAISVVRVDMVLRRIPRW